MTEPRANAVEVPPTGIVIAVQFYADDQTRAFRLARLLAAIEPRFRDDVTFCFARRFDVEMSAELWAASLEVGKKFKVMHVRSKREGVGHPAGSFGIWAGTLDALAEGWASGSLRAHSAFMIEADGVPLRADWIDIIIEEHRKTIAAGKRITGAEMIEGTPHANGGLAMAFSCWLDRPSLHRCPEAQAFDLFNAPVILSETRFTGRLRNIYGGGDYSDKTLRALRRECAWLLSSKDDSALEFAERTLPRRVRKTTEVRHYATACREYQWSILFKSMAAHCKPFVLHVLAWDWDPASEIATWGEGGDACPALVKFTRRDQFLERHPCILPLPGPPRNANETACTVRWRFACDVMEDTGQPLTMIDGDQFFLSSPESVFDEIGDAPCAVSPHNFAPAAMGLPGITMESHSKFSLFNGGWSYFADRDALEHMRKLADEWCKIGWRKMPDGRMFFGDQGNLTLLVEQHGAHVIQHKGCNLGPWSAVRWPAEIIDGKVHVGGAPLVSYHFQSLRLDESGAVVQLADPSYCVPKSYVDTVYAPYLAELTRA
jgi:hypothetical protein